MPDALKLFVYREVMSGSTPAEVAEALGLSEDWVRDYAEAARLCFERQVVVNPTGSCRSLPGALQAGWGV